MPSFRHPLTRRVTQPDRAGPMRLLLRPALSLELERAPGDWVTIPEAVVDTGSNLCIFSAAWARATRLTLPAASSLLPLSTAGDEVTARVYDVRSSARFPQLPERPFPLAIVFSEAFLPTRPPLLGLYNLLETWRVVFDGTPAPDAPRGHMRFETL